MNYASPAVPEAPADLEVLFRTHYASMRRLLRRLGVPDANLDDVAQELFWIAARRIDEIRSGSEHAFLYGVALRLASTERRRLKAAPTTCDLEETRSLRASGPTPEQELGKQQARQLLYSVLDRMTPDLRTIFALYELEHLEVKQIAELQQIPVGTASSRLRRARQEFSGICQRVNAERRRKGL